MTYKVGTSYKGQDLNEGAPIGTIVQLVPNGNPEPDYTRVKVNDGQWYYTDVPWDGLMELSSTPTYQIVALPGAEADPEVDEREELAKQLWEIRNQAVAESGYDIELEWGGGNPEIYQTIYRRLTDFVLENFERKGFTTEGPTEVSDNDGTHWYLTGNGLWSINEFSEEAERTLENIVDRWGPVKVIR